MRMARNILIGFAALMAVMIVFLLTVDLGRFKDTTEDFVSDINRARVLRALGKEEEADVLEVQSPSTSAGFYFEAQHAMTEAHEVGITPGSRL